ncbi:2Fe-2S iron-sulfur cluster-binding protein [Niveispirillum fermenti]|uniref:2Fe-2S iron-sulfur cluster-binding protein n=1 Tax=Niveispirillum fermenti TaxID=1233113 RepID=UPI003A882BD9
MPEIMIVMRSGETRPVDGAEGQSVMLAARDAGIDELEGFCGGCCACASCHVYVDPAFAGRLPPIGADEDELLEGSGHRRPHSRLSCQLSMTDALAGLRLTVAPEG